MYYTKHNPVGRIALIAVVIFGTFHVLNWSAKCGPFASGKYRDYCADLDQVRATKAFLIVNATTVARSKAAARTPYVDLQDSSETLEEFLPAGWGRTKSTANVREGPGMTYEVTESLAKGAIVEIVEEQDGWLKVRVNAPGDAEAFGWVWRDLLAH